MKTFRIIYWIATSIIALMMIYSGYAYFTQANVEQAFQHLGYPGYFRIELALAKFIGAVLLLAPVGVIIKEWAYAGFAFTFISAFIAHTASGDPIPVASAPLVFLVVLGVSYFAYRKTRVEMRYEL